MARPRNKSGELPRTERRAQVARLRRGGMTQDQIAAHIGVNQATVSRDLAELEGRLKQVASDDIDAWRGAQLDKYQRLADQIADDINTLREAGEHAKLANLYRRLIDIDERESKLLGLDAPTRVEAVVEQMSDEDAERLIRQAQASDRDA